MPKKRRKKLIENYPPSASLRRTSELKITNDNKEVGQGQTGNELAGDRGKKAKKLKVKNLTAPKVENFELVNQPSAADGAKLDAKQAEQKKRLMMWVGVSCLMVIFFMVWLFNLKYEFKASLKKGADNGFNWSQTKTELDKAMKQVKQGLTEVKKIQENLKQNTLSGQLKLNPEQINFLKGKLLDEVASNTAASTKK